MSSIVWRQFSMVDAYELITLRAMSLLNVTFKVTSLNGEEITITTTIEA